MHNFGVGLPRSVDKAYTLDAGNCNVICTNIIVKEITDFTVSFKDLDDYEDVPIGYAYVCCHIIFVVKMEDF